MSQLWLDYCSAPNTGLGLNKTFGKWMHYLPNLERHFTPWRDHSVTMWEIGVLEGGSLQAWQRFFGPYARIVGLDINPDCKQHERTGISVRIGDQADLGFLQNVMDELGEPDVVLDDGGHQQAAMIATFNWLYPRMGKNAVYALEDLHTSYWSDFGGNSPGSFMEFAKRCLDQLNADQAAERAILHGLDPHATLTPLEPDFITRETRGVHFYDSMAVFEKGDVPLEMKVPR